MSSKFDKIVGAEAGEGDHDEQNEYTPRVIFTNDSTPDLSKLQISQLRLAQGMTAEVAERRASIGQYVLSNFPPADEVELVPLAAQNIRTYKPDPKAPPQCQAPTGVWGIGDPGIECAKCPLSKWGPRNEKTGKATPPPCKEGVFIRAYSITHRTVVDFQFMGRNVGKGAFVQSQAMALGYNNFVIRMRSSNAKNDRGQWVEPEIEMLGDVPAEHRDISNRWYEALMASTRQSSDDVVKALQQGQTPSS